MKAEGLVWLGTRKFDDTVRFFGDALGLPKEHEERDFAIFFGTVRRLRYSGPATASTSPRGPSQVSWSTRSDLECTGITFIGPIHEADGGSRSHFIAPDGNVYEITASPKH